MIRLNVFVSVSEANRAKVLRAAKELTKLSLQEEGNVAYDVFESSTRHDVLLICETWKDAEALAKHEQTAHFEKYVGEIKANAQMKAEKFNF